MDYQFVHERETVLLAGHCQHFSSYIDMHLNTRLFPSAKTTLIGGVHTLTQCVTACREQKSNQKCNGVVYHESTKKCFYFYGTFHYHFFDAPGWRFYGTYYDVQCYPSILPGKLCYLSTPVTEMNIAYNVSAALHCPFYMDLGSKLEERDQRV